MSGSPQISAANFFRRVKSLYSQWKDVFSLLIILPLNLFRLKKNSLTLMLSAFSMVKIMTNPSRSKLLLSSISPLEFHFLTPFLVSGYLVMNLLIQCFSSPKNPSSSLPVKNNSHSFNISMKKKAVWMKILKSLLKEKIILPPLKKSNLSSKVNLVTLNSRFSLRLFIPPYPISLDW